ncbi:MAG: hypothetical protein R2861_00455 [Desulfobacterales bacterium]
MKLLIIGGVAGGATAAARAELNEEAEIILFERGDLSPLPIAAFHVTSVM